MLTLVCVSIKVSRKNTKLIKKANLLYLMRTNSSRWGWGGGGIEWGELSKGREGGPPSTWLPCHYQLNHKPTCGERSKFDWVLFTPRKGIWSQNKIRNKSYYRYIYIWCVFCFCSLQSQTSSCTIGGSLPPHKLFDTTNLLSMNSTVWMCLELEQ